jgi:hypothetical protein
MAFKFALRKFSNPLYKKIHLQILFNFLKKKTAVYDRQNLVSAFFVFKFSPSTGYPSVLLLVVILSPLMGMSNCRILPFYIKSSHTQAFFLFPNNNKINLGPETIPFLTHNDS